MTMVNSMINLEWNVLGLIAGSLLLILTPARNLTIIHTESVWKWVDDDVDFGQLVAKEDASGSQVELVSIEYLRLLKEVLDAGLFI